MCPVAMFPSSAVFHLLPRKIKLFARPCAALIPNIFLPVDDLVDSCKYRCLQVIISDPHSNPHVLIFDRKVQAKISLFLLQKKKRTRRRTQKIKTKRDKPGAGDEPKRTEIATGNGSVVRCKAEIPVSRPSHLHLKLFVVLENRKKKKEKGASCTRTTGKTQTWRVANFCRR